MNSNTFKGLMEHEWAKSPGVQQSGMLGSSNQLEKNNPPKGIKKQNKTPLLLKQNKSTQDVSPRATNLL